MKAEGTRTEEAIPRRRQAKPGSGEVTRLLRAWSEGDVLARDRLMPLVYAELRRQARVTVQVRGGTRRA
jgi:hypothetical protein